MQLESTFTIISVPFSEPVEISGIVNDFNRCKRLAYERLREGLNPSEVARWIRANIKTNLDTSWLQNVIAVASQALSSRKALGLDLGLVWGGKHNFKKLISGKITKNEWFKLRNNAVNFIGSAERQGNRKFRLDYLKNKQIIFQPKKGIKILLKLGYVSKNQHKILEHLEELAKQRKIPLSYSLTSGRILICYDASKLEMHKAEKSIEDRILAIDGNPNFIGMCVVDHHSKKEPQIILRECFDLRGLSKTKKNKKHNEVLNLIKEIVKRAKHYKVEYVAIEKLQLRSKDHKKGKLFNRIVNNWNRGLFYKNLKKWLAIYKIKTVEIPCEYSSFVGCLTNSKETDSIAASIEIARRCHLYTNIYYKNNLPRGTDIVFPKFDARLINRWKEDSSTDGLLNWKDWFAWFKKNPKLGYRVHYDDWVKINNLNVSSVGHRKSLVAHVTA